MCIELHKPSAESVNAHLACEQDEKFVPSQFERGSIADVVRDGMDKMHREGFELAKIRILRLLLDYDYALYGKLYKQIEELKP